jgi:hypothetical protein
MLNIKSLIMALVGIVVGLALFPTIKTASDTAYETARNLNASGLYSAGTSAVSGYQLIGLIPMLYIIILFAGAVGYVYVSSK